MAAGGEGEREGEREGGEEEDMSLNGFHLVGVFGIIESILGCKDTKKCNSQRNSQQKSRKTAGYFCFSTKIL